MAWSKALNKKYFKKRNINQIKIKDPRAGKTGTYAGNNWGGGWQQGGPTEGFKPPTPPAPTPSSKEEIA